MRLIFLKEDIADHGNCSIDIVITDFNAIKQDEWLRPHSGHP